MFNDRSHDFLFKTESREMLTQDQWQNEEIEPGQFDHLERAFKLKVRTRRNLEKVASLFGLKVFIGLDQVFSWDGTQDQQQEHKKISEVFSLVSECFTKSAFFTFFGQSSPTNPLLSEKKAQNWILYKMMPIAWPQLQNLSLEQNHITNIEALLYLRGIENVRCLDLGFNRVTRARSLARCNSKSMQHINLGSNNLVQLEYQLFDMPQLCFLDLSINPRLIITTQFDVKFRPGPIETQICIDLKQDLIPKHKRKSKTENFVVL